MVFPPAFLMGGTIPILGQCLISRQAEFGTRAARIYAVNTIGAACGAFATAFVLIGNLGFRLTCVVAIGVSTVAAVLAFKLSRNVATVEGIYEVAANPPQFVSRWEPGLHPSWQADNPPPRNPSSC